MQRGISGGRCMTNRNQKYHVKKDTVDLDAYSLFPAAMNRLYLTTGLPSIIPSYAMNTKYLLSHLFEEGQEIRKGDRHIGCNDCTRDYCLSKFINLLFNERKSLKGI